MPRDTWDDEDRRDYRRDERRRERGHSALGIVSFAAAVLSGLGIFAVVAVAGVMTAGGDLPDDSSEAVALGLGALLGVFTALVALVLGVVGLFQGGNRLFATLGTVVGSLVLLASAALAVLGVVAG